MREGVLDKVELRVGGEERMVPRCAKHRHIHHLLRLHVEMHSDYMKTRRIDEAYKVLINLRLDSLEDLLVLSDG